jgi:hypothetical protein
VDAVVDLKGVQELHQDVVFGLLAGLDVGVLLGVVFGYRSQKFILFTSDFLEGNGATVVSVELAEGLLDELDSKGSHGASDRSQELVVIDVAVLVCIEDAEKSLDVLLTVVQSEVVDCLGELRQVQILAVVVVDDLEESGEADYTSGTSGENFISEQVQKVVVSESAALLDDGLGFFLGSGS